MTQQYVVHVEGLTYPVGRSLDTVRAAGGLSKVPAEQGEALEFRRPVVGEVVDDVPAESLSWMLEQGWVRPLEDAPRKAGAGGRRRAAPERAEGGERVGEEDA